MQDVWQKGEKTFSSSDPPQGRRHRGSTTIIRKASTYHNQLHLACVEQRAVLIV